jgi:hypothetical protein
LMSIVGLCCPWFWCMGIFFASMWILRFSRYSTGFQNSLLMRGLEKKTRKFWTLIFLTFLFSLNRTVIRILKLLLSRNDASISNVFGIVFCSLCILSAIIPVFSLIFSLYILRTFKPRHRVTVGKNLHYVEGYTMWSQQF